MKAVIVGGGVAGLSIGWRLAQAGCDVVVLERGSPGRGATWASGGMIAAAAETGHADTPDAAFAQKSARMWPDFAAEIERQSQSEIHYRRSGTLIAALSREEFESLSSHASPRTMMLSPEETLDLEPMLRNDVAGALSAPDDAQVDNRALGLALALALVNAGGVLQTNEAVVRFEMGQDRVLGVRTPFALHEGDVFVLAAGAWSGEMIGLPPGAIPPVVPVKGEMIALDPPDGRKLPTHLVWGEGIYLIPRHRRLFVGATVAREGFDTSTTDGARAWLFRRAVSLMPDLRHWPIAEQWAGLRPGTPDDLPILGETSVPGLFVASGQFRNGILFAPAIAEALHSFVMEQRSPPEIAAFAPGRFQDARQAGAGVVQ
jgi:glycine oxidase